MSEFCTQAHIKLLFCGLRSNSEPIMAVFRGFIDESFDTQHFVMGGYVATENAWLSFTEEWEHLLPHGVMGEDGIYRFHLKEMMKTEERRSRIPAFWNVIQRHCLFSCTVYFDLKELEQVKQSLVGNYGPIDWGPMADPYYLAYRTLMDKFHTKRSDFALHLPTDAYIEFVFDEHTKQKVILSSWGDYYANRPIGVDVKHPIFRKDHEVLPLQAADCWAGVARYIRNGELQLPVNIFPADENGLPLESVPAYVYPLDRIKLGDIYSRLLKLHFEQTK